MKIIKDKITALVVCLLLTASFTACHSSKSATSKTNAAGTEQWHDVRLPVKVSLKSPMSMSLSGRATMVRDSVINISMRVFGMEVAVAHVNNDSVFFIDKHNKYYFAEPLQSVLGTHKMTVAQMQNLILGQTDKTEMEFSNPGSNEPVVVTFSDFSDTDFGRMASVAAIAAPVKGMDVEASLIWSIDEARWNTSPQVSFKAPGSKYKRITIARIRTLFGN